MKLFCSFAFTDENPSEVTRRMQQVVATLENAGHEAYCILFDTSVESLQAQDNVQGLLAEAFMRVEQSDVVIAIVTSPSRSVGQIMEIGAALSRNKPVLLFEHTSASGSSYLPKLVSNHCEWETLDDLLASLSKI